MTETLRPAKELLAAIAFRQARSAFSHFVCSVTPGGFAQSWNCSSQVISIVCPFFQTDFSLSFSPPKDATRAPVRRHNGPRFGSYSRSRRLLAQGSSTHNADKI